jgi:hypothetical protein
MSEIGGINPIYTNEKLDSVMASAQMMVTYRNGTTNSTDSKANSANELLNQSMGNSILKLTGCTLDEVLYYVSKERPVLAMKDTDNAVLIIAYDAYNITVIDPALHKTMKIGLKDGQDMFRAAGNIFVCYVTGNK